MDINTRVLNGKTENPEHEEKSQETQLATEKSLAQFLAEAESD